MIDENIIVIPGSGWDDLQPLQTVAGEFGWAVKIVHDLNEALVAEASRKTAALLFNRDALGPGQSWLESVHLLKFAMPEVRLIACHGFSESIDWPELSEAGVFHNLWLPLKESEVRQSLGFIAAAEKRLTTPIGRFPETLSAQRLLQSGRVTMELPLRAVLRPGHHVDHPPLRAPRERKGWRSIVPLQKT